MDGAGRLIRLPAIPKPRSGTMLVLSFGRGWRACCAGAGAKVGSSASDSCAQRGHCRAGHGEMPMGPNEYGMKGLHQHAESDRA